MRLRTLLNRYKPKFGFTLFLVVAEALLTLLFPLFIGYAIDDALEGGHGGALKLGLLGIATLVVGVGRRVFDSRFYARVYEDVGTKVLSHLPENQPSVKSARLGMLRELVEFLENALPELVNTVIGLAGVIAIIATLNLQVFGGSMLVTAIIFLLYALSSRKTTRFNQSSNDELEKQVAIISRNEEGELKTHLRKMMHWNIKLSDLEAMNFSLSWIVLMSFLVAFIILSVNGEVVQYGALFALIMYVFQYMESVVNLPFFYQHWLRLKEIQSRLETA